MKVLAVIQARYNSSRLRGKVLMDLGGVPVLQRVVERVKKSRSIDEAVVATGIGRENLPVLELCARLGTRVFAGAEDDVLDRFYQLARLLRPQYVVRVTADCPFFDWTLLDTAIEQMRADSDYCADFDETLPDGLDLEIMRFAVLETAWKKAALRSEREHVTLYIKNRPEVFRLQNFRNPAGDFGHLRLTLDEAEDYALLRKLTDYFAREGRQDFLQKDILAYFEAFPKDKALNAMHARNEGLAKSLAEDGAAPGLAKPRAGT